MQLSLVLVLKSLYSTAPATNTQNQNPHLPCSTWFLAEARQKARGRSLASAAGLGSLMFFVSCLFVLPGSGSTLIDRSGSRVFLLHRAHPNSAPSVLFAQHLAAVFVFVISHLPVPNSDHHDHQKDKFLVDIMVLHASYSLP